MAPRKRLRDVDDVDGDDVEVEVEAASSSLRNSATTKRSRVTLAQENGGSVVSDEDSDNDESEPQGNTRSNAPGDFSDNEDEDIDELRATQIVEKQIRKYKDNLPSEQGVIEEIFCRNFMCHTKLRIKLGPLINFIVGHNGSGKSAVLTALTVCLGGKATATNRGANMKSLIKEGTDNATLAVKIKNRGDGAYKPELYGTSITVERNFTRAGTSGFKLKNQHDKIVSTKKADLDDILDFFAFQLDNPINVLTQDMARQFLSNSTAGDKYKFFIRGTQLEVLDADYKLMEEHLDSIEAKLHSRKQDMEVLKRKEEEAEKRKKRLERTGAIQDKIKRLQWMHAWAQVEEQERELEILEKRLEEVGKNLQEKTDAAEDVEGAYEGHNQSWEAAQRTLADFREQVEPLRDHYQGEKEKFDANSKELKELLAQQRAIKEDVKKSKADVAKYETDIADEQQRLAGAEGVEHLARLEKLEELKSAAEDVKREQMNHGTSFADIERRRAGAQQALDAEKPLQSQRKERLQKAEQRLHNVQQNQPRPFAGYRQNMENLARAINRETRWRSKPVGPIGQHIKLLKMEWSSQIERTFGGVLDSFIVSCKEDQDMLSQLMKRVNCSPNIFIGHGTALDVSGKEPDDVETILRVLEIDNHAVRSQLIINQAIEQTVLISDRQQAYAYMYETNPRPRNVKATICHDTHNKRRGIRFEWSRSGAGKTSPVPEWNEQRMKSDHEDRIRGCQSEIEQANRELADAEQQMRTLTANVEKAKQEIVRFQRRQKELVTASQKAEDAIEALQNEIDSNRPQDGKLQELERILRELNEDVEGGEASLMDSYNARDKLNETAKDLKGRADAAKGELDRMAKQVEKAEQRVSDNGQARIQALREKNLALQFIEDAKREQTAAEQRRDHQQRNTEEFIELAGQVCQRITVDPGLTCDVIDERIVRLEADRNRAEREAGGSREELELAWQKARLDHAEAAGKLEDMIKFSEVSASMMLCSTS